MKVNKTVFRKALLTGIFISFAYVAYAMFVDGLLIKDERTGRVLFGFDHRTGSFLFYQYLPVPFETDGPYVLFRNNKAMIVRTKPAPSPASALNVDIISSSWLMNDGISVKSNTTARAFTVPVHLDNSAPPAIYDMPEKMVAVSNIEGNFYALTAILISLGVTDADLNWTFGEGHLVVDGDVMDVGNDVTACLWLIYRLEQQARQYGGVVHFILGDHEQMNIQGNASHAQPRYPYLAEIIRLNYADLFSDASVLGKWLRSKNVIERIGEYVFVHGGVTRQISELGLQLEEINSIVKTNLSRPLEELQFPASVLLGEESGILQYRGWVEANDGFAKLDETDVASILDRLHASVLVVAHTVVNDISSDFNGRVIRLDVTQPDKPSAGTVRALLFEHGLYVVDGSGNRRPLRVE